MIRLLERFIVWFEYRIPTKHDREIEMLEQLYNMRAVSPQERNVR